MLIGVVLTAVSLAVNAAISARSDAPGRRLAQLAYVDEVRRQVERSTAQGVDIAQVRAEAPRLGRDGIRRRLDRVVREADSVVASVQAAEPPRSLATAHSVLVATAVIRARAAVTIRDALSKVLGSQPPAVAVEALAGAADDMAAADATYRSFVAILDGAGVTATPPLPASRWVDGGRDWSRPELTAFVRSLRASASLAPVHDVAVVVVTTDPAAVGSEGQAALLPLAKALRVQAVVANTGNEAEPRVPLVVSVAGPTGDLDSAREFVSLAAGQRRAVTLRLRMAAGGPFAVNVVVGPVAGEADASDNRHSIPIVVRG